MSITKVADGSAVNTTTTTLALVAPTLKANDWLIAVITTHDNTAITGQDARWISVYSANNTAAQRVTVFAMSCNGGDSGATFNFTVAGTTAALGRLSAFRGVQGIGNSSSSANASSATITWATMTANTKDGTSVILAIFATAVQTGSDGGLSAGTPPTVTFNTATYYSAGTTDAIGLYEGYTGTANATGSRTMNNTGAAVNTGIFVELLAIEQGAGAGQAGVGPVAFPTQPRTRADGRRPGDPLPY